MYNYKCTLVTELKSKVRGGAVQHARVVLRGAGSQGGESPLRTPRRSTALGGKALDKPTCAPGSL